MLDQKNKTERENTGDKFNEFIQRNRTVIFSVISIIIILFIGAIIYISVKENMDIKAAEKIDDLNRRFGDLKENIKDEESQDDVNTLLDELKIFAAKTRGFSGSKAWGIIGDIYSEKEKWMEAEEAYLNAAKIGKKTYLGPLAFFNAAAAAEEQGSLEKAIDYLTQSLSLNIEFPAAPRAQFSIGRLNEQLGNYNEAKDAYFAVINNWSDLPVWQQLANSRIIAIDVKGPNEVTEN